MVKNGLNHGFLGENRFQGWNFFFLFVCCYQIQREGGHGLRKRINGFVWVVHSLDFCTVFCFLRMSKEKRIWDSLYALLSLLVLVCIGIHFLWMQGLAYNVMMPL
jgi:hypothetical protein